MTIPGCKKRGLLFFLDRKERSRRSPNTAFLFSNVLICPGRQLGIWVWGKIGSNVVKSGQSSCKDKHMRNEKVRFTRNVTHNCCTTPAECMLPLTLAMRSSR